jgi:trehalose synthase
MYTMVEIPREDWGLLPEVKSPWQPVHVPKPAAEALARKRYIPGLINSNDASPEAKSWSGWSATSAVVGADGKSRRWVFLHYFKPNQPALNWLDPSYAARRAVAGDVVRTVLQRKTRVVRLDAVPFLGIEPKPGEPGTTEHFKHPLSVVGTNDVAMLVRKLGGWSFHELNVPLADLAKFTANGPDLSYNFVTRAQGLHALLSGDAAANALQPGVFSLSSWDVVGALPVSGPEVEKRAADGDHRWANRGGVDLTGANPEAGASAFGLPRAKALYGPLPG